jgi:hypothetical protein
MGNSREPVPGRFDSFEYTSRIGKYIVTSMSKGHVPHSEIVHDPQD